MDITIKKICDLENVVFYEAQLNNQVIKFNLQHLINPFNNMNKYLLSIDGFHETDIIDLFDSEEEAFEKIIEDINNYCI